MNQVQQGGRFRVRSLFLNCLSRSVVERRVGVLCWHKTFVGRRKRSKESHERAVSGHGQYGGACSGGARPAAAALYWIFTAIMPRCFRPVPYTRHKQGAKWKKARSWQTMGQYCTFVPPTLCPCILILLTPNSLHGTEMEQIRPTCLRYGVRTFFASLLSSISPEDDATLAGVRIGRPTIAF